MSDVCIVGLGYVGLPTAILCAMSGHEVVGVDINTEVVEKLNKGEVHIVENGLDALLKRCLADKKFKAVLAPLEADTFVIAVPTPFEKDSHAPVLDFIKAATQSIAPKLREGNTVILESTSPVGTTVLVCEWLQEMRPDLLFPVSDSSAADVNIAYCPERVLPGRAMQEINQNDRIIGGLSNNCSEAARNFYKTFVDGDCFITNANTAEMCKLAENSFRDVNIAFANELSMMCEHFDLNVWELISLANRHPRVSILNPGVGVGGHCISVDPWFIIHKFPETAKLISTARKVNTLKADWVVDKVKSAILDLVQHGKLMNEIKICCLGLSYKENIDDLRESPALHIVQELINQLDCCINVVEPNSNQEKILDIQLVSIENALENADIVVPLVAHDEFKNIDFRKSNLIDCIGLCEPKA